MVCIAAVVRDVTLWGDFEIDIRAQTGLKAKYETYILPPLPHAQTTQPWWIYLQKGQEIASNVQTLIKIC